MLAYGTDGEEEFYRALKFNFPYAVHLRCFMHFREICKTQLRESNVPEAQQKEYLADIFGRKKFVEKNFWGHKTEVSLTAISSLESGRRKFFMNSTYIMSRK